MNSDITLLAAPAFILCILFELAIDRRRKTHYYRLNDAFGSMALGIMSKTTGLITFGQGLLPSQAFIDQGLTKV